MESMVIQPERENNETRNGGINGNGTVGNGRTGVTSVAGQVVRGGGNQRTWEGKYGTKKGSKRRNRGNE